MTTGDQPTPQPARRLTARFKFIGAGVYKIDAVYGRHRQAITIDMPIELPTFRTNVRIAVPSVRR